MATSANLMRLSFREQEILRLIAEGHTSPAIAAQLGISLHTVRHHRRNILRKLNAPNGSALVATLTRHHDSHVPPKPP